MKNIIVTGCAGFIGMHTSIELLKKKFNVIGIDNINNYYSTKLKLSRLKELEKFEHFKFFKFNLINKKKLEYIFKKYKPTYLIHLAAQAGVRNSIINPDAYTINNIYAFQCILEVVKKYKIKHMIYASSSSVYGLNKKIPFSEKDQTSLPANYYAVSKISNELAAYYYSNNFKINISGLRFFTVYGPWGRPDMAYYKFLLNQIKKKKNYLHGNGKMRRDFTYIDDVVFQIPKLLKKKNKKFHEIYNIGNNSPETTNKLIYLLEKNFKKKIKLKKISKQLGEIKTTYADIAKLKKKIKFTPKVSMDDGIKKFVKWFKIYHKC